MPAIDSLPQHGDRKTLENLEKAAPDPTSSLPSQASEGAAAPVAPPPQGAAAGQFDPSVIDQAVNEEIGSPLDNLPPGTPPELVFLRDVWANIASHGAASRDLEDIYSAAKQDLEEAQNSNVEQNNKQSEQLPQQSNPQTNTNDSEVVALLKKQVELTTQLMEKLSSSKDNKTT